MKSVSVVLIIMLLAVGCAPSGSGGGGGSYKPLESTWTNTTNSATHVDLSNILIFSGIAVYRLFYLNGGQCTVHVEVTGTDGSGAIVVDLSTYTGGGGGVDPGCAGLLGSYTYSNSNATLSLCPVSAPTACGVYQ